MAKAKLKNELVGLGRSQAEEMVIALLRLKYPGLKIKRNDKSVLGRQEIDIHLTDYKIAIEVDGITHSKPIYGQERFLEMQARDVKKEVKLKELGYYLFRIDIGEVPSAKMYPFLKEHVNTVLVPKINEIVGAVKC